MNRQKQLNGNKKNDFSTDVNILNNLCSSENIVLKKRRKTYSRCWKGSENETKKEVYELTRQKNKVEHNVSMLKVSVQFRRSEYRKNKQKYLQESENEEI